MWVELLQGTTCHKKHTLRRPLDRIQRIGKARACKMAVCHPSGQLDRLDCRLLVKVKTLADHAAMTAPFPLTYTAVVHVPVSSVTTAT